MKKIFLLIICLCLTACLGGYLGDNTPPGEDSPFTKLATTLGLWLPGGLGVGLIAAAKMAHGAIRVKNALFDTTKRAIDNGSLVGAANKNEVKQALKDAQKVHDNSKVLAKAYDNYKNGGVFKKFWLKLRSYFKK